MINSPVSQQQLLLKVLGGVTACATWGCRRGRPSHEGHSDGDDSSDESHDDDGVDARGEAEERVR